MFPRTPSEESVRWDGVYSPSSKELAYSPYSSSYTTHQSTQTRASWTRPHEYGPPPSPSPSRLPPTPRGRSRGGFSPYYSKYPTPDASSSLATGHGDCTPDPYALGEWRGTVSPGRGRDTSQYHAKAAILPSPPPTCSHPLVAPAARPLPGYDHDRVVEAALDPLGRLEESNDVTRKRGGWMDVSSWGCFGPSGTRSEFDPYKPRSGSYSAWECLLEDPPRDAPPHLPYDVADPSVTNFRPPPPPSFSSSRSR